MGDVPSYGVSVTTTISLVAVEDESTPLEGTSFTGTESSSETGSPPLRGRSDTRAISKGAAFGTGAMGGVSTTRGVSSGQLGLAPSPYAQVLEDLLPPGKAWTRASDAEITAFLEALSYEYGRVGARAQVLLETESDPSQAVELLPEWLAFFGLANNPNLTTQAQQQQAIIAKLVGMGPTRSVSFFTAVAAALGYSITITTYPPMVANSPCNATLYQGAWIFVWTVTTAHGSNDAFLQELFASLQPDHTQLFFVFT